MINSAILYHERLNFLRRGPALAIVALVVVSIMYAGWSGDRWRDLQLHNLTTFESTAQESLGTFREQLVDIESGAVEPSPYDANPMSILIPGILPPASLADFAVGHADLHPASAELSTWRNQSSVFGRYQFDNPTTLAASSFDVAMVVVVLLPLLMIAASFDVLAGERSRGTLTSLLAAPLRLRDLVWTRLLFRNSIIWFAAIAVMLVLALVNDAGGDRLARFGIWLGVSLLYLFLWLALMAWCIARFRSATATAGALVVFWLLFTLALPAAISTLSESLYPTPSRLAYLSEIRTAEGETSRNLAEATDNFLTDHPDLTVGDEELPSFYRAGFLASQMALENTKSISDGYAAARAGRNQTLRWAQYLSPAIIAQRLLHQSAGADLQRQHRFQAQVQQSLQDLGDAIGPAVVSRNRLSVAEFDQLPVFAFVDRSAAQIVRSAVGPGVFLLFVSIFLVVAANRRLDQDDNENVTE